MIIQVESTTTKYVEAAKQSLEALAHDWDCEISAIPAETAVVAGTTDRDDKVIDPVSVASLVLSIPPAALAVADLADRIGKRRRAKELIDHAQHLAGQQVTVRIRSQDRTVDLRTLTPDQLLDLQAGEDPAS